MNYFNDNSASQKMPYEQWYSNRLTPGFSNKTYTMPYQHPYSISKPFRSFPDQHYNSPIFPIHIRKQKDTYYHYYPPAITKKRTLKHRSVYTKTMLLDISQSPLCVKPEVPKQFEDILSKSNSSDQSEVSKNAITNRELVYLSPYLQLLQFTSFNRTFQQLRQDFKYILQDISTNKSTTCCSRIISLITKLNIELVSIAECMKCLVMEIFTKAQEGVTSQVGCADLCAQIIDCEKESKTNWSLRLFINDRCKNMFLMPLKKQMKLITENWEQKIKSSNYEMLRILYANNTEKVIRKSQKIYYKDIRFIAELYKCDILKPTIINACISNLLSNYKDETSVSSLLQFLEICGKKFNTEHSDKLEKHIANLTNIVESKPISPTVQNVLFKIIHMSQRNWSELVRDTNEIYQADIRLDIDLSTESKEPTRRQRKKIKKTIQNVEEMKDQNTSETKYFELIVIDPRSVMSVEQKDVSDWRIGDKVYFILGLSYTKVDGSIQWTGYVNGILVGVVQVGSVVITDPIGEYICREETFEISLDDNSNGVIVLLAAIHKAELTNQYLVKIFESGIDASTAMNVVMDMVNNNDTSAIKSIINVWNWPIKLEQYPTLLPMLIGQHNYDVIRQLLSHLITSDNDHGHLLEVARHFLLAGDLVTFDEVVSKCSDVNCVHNDGETFLTWIMREVKDEVVIVRVIESDRFDINQPNGDGDTALVLACKMLMIDVVRSLVDNGASVTYRDNLALRTVVDMENNMTHDMPEKYQKVGEIIKLLTKEDRRTFSACSICGSTELTLPIDGGFDTPVCCSKCNIHTNLIPPE